MANKMYDVTPMPDLEDDNDLGQYMQDRRVLGVRDQLSLSASSLTACHSMILSFNPLFSAQNLASPSTHSTLSPQPGTVQPASYRAMTIASS
jgi:hypothetical protein